jgi:uncharacterized lipoprotein YddW (UPF0748 family)
MPKKKKGWGLGDLPISLVLLLAGLGYWWLIYLGNFNKLWTQVQAFMPSVSSPLLSASSPSPTLAPTQPLPSPSPSEPSLPSSQQPQTFVAPTPSLQPLPSSPKSTPIAAAQIPLVWEKKPMRGIYLSRYQATNNADEQTIRERVRYYKSQGINTIIQGVWGNGCTMYNSIILQQTLGFKSCPNQFQDQWLDWMIDEAQKQGMQVHAYFEKGIKIDKDSPILELARSRKWLVPGVDKTYAGVDHYVLDVEIPEVANLFRQISSEFVRRYPKIHAVQWDDYLGYHAELPGQTDRTAYLTQFVLQMRADLKKANPAVSFDICHHNPYWAKRYFAADWEQWQVDRVFIQVYNDKNFREEMGYVEKYAGVAIADTQLHRLPDILKNPKLKHVLIFPVNGNPEQAAAMTLEKARQSSIDQKSSAN